MSDPLERYRRGEAIGAGSFATVYRAHDELLDGEVVVKVLAENHSLNPEVRERFIAEGRSLRRVAGPHVVAVHDIGETDRHQPFLVLEYADRGTLANRVSALLARGWTARPVDVLSVARPLAAALESVHRAQLVHRDLSPGNLLLTTDATPAGGPAPSGPAAEVVRPGERLLVADLGLCKDLALNSGLTVSGGTEGFRPPEQDRPGLVDARADIWAATALLSWVAIGAELPAAFDRFVRHGMHHDPRRRPADIAAWLAELEAALVSPRAQPPTPGAGRSPHGPGTQAAATGRAADDADPTSRQDAEASPDGEGTGRRRPGARAALVGALVLLALLAGVVLGSLPGGRGGPDSSAEGASIAIEGPDRVQVGQTVTFSARTEGVDGWAWTLPTGTHLVDESQATLTATSTGTTEIVLRARVPGGPELEARHEVRVVE